MTYRRLRPGGLPAPHRPEFEHKPLKNKDHALALAQEHGILRAKTARAHGIHGATLSDLVARGSLVRTARGLYMLPDADVSEHHNLAEGGRRYPDAVVCLLSALRFHDLTTENPHQLWLAIEASSYRPDPADLPLRLVEMSGAAFTHGVETHEIDQVPVRVTSPAKTVADCFRFRSLVGLDVAIEALRGYVRERAGTIDALSDAATACRITTVIRPYIEAAV